MRRFLLICSVSTLTACTQSPVDVVMLGDLDFSQKTFARASNGAAPSSQVASLAPASGSYSAPASVSYAPVSYASTGGSESYDAMRASNSYEQSTSAAAPVSSMNSMSVSDLPPPEEHAGLNSPRGSMVELKPLSYSSEKTTTVASIPQAEPAPQVPAMPRYSNQKASSHGFIWPVQGKVISRFGPQGNGKTNDGISIAAATGEPVYAAADGEVVFADDELKGYGNMALIRHADGQHTTYAHLSRLDVMRYDRVKRGQLIGYVGQSGNVSSPQLFFALQKGKTPVDPELYLNNSFAQLN